MVFDGGLKNICDNYMYLYIFRLDVILTIAKIDVFQGRKHLVTETMSPLSLVQQMCSPLKVRIIYLLCLKR